MSDKLKLRLLLPLTLVLLWYSCASTGTSKKKKDAVREGDTITVIGEAPIYQGDKQLAKQKAIKDAKVNAVRKIIGEEISSKTGVADGESLGSSLLSKTTAFVKSYDIISERTYKMDTTDVLELSVRCKVEESKISTAVDGLLADIGNPKIMVLVKGSQDGVPIVPGAANNKAEVEIVNALKKNKNNVIDINVARAQVSKNKSALSNISSADDSISGSPLVRMGQDAGADVLIIGELELVKQPTITTGPGGRLTGATFFSAAATITYKVVLLWGDGKALPGGSYDGRGADITQPVAYDRATIEVAQKVGKNISKTLKDEWFQMSESNSIILRFKGLDLEEATKFADDLKEFTGVKDINQRTNEVSGSEWEVIYPGKESMLSEELVYKKDRGFSFIGKKEMEIVSSSRGVVTISFKNIK